MGWVEQSPNSVREDTRFSYLLRVLAWASKTRRERVIGLTDEVVAILKEESKGKASDTPLFPSDHHKTYKATALRIGYHQPITLRDLRHCEYPL